MYFQYLRVRDMTPSADKLEQVKKFAKDNVNHRFRKDIFTVFLPKFQIRTFTFSFVQAALILFPLVFLSWTIFSFAYILKMDYDNRQNFLKHSDC